MTPEQKRLLVPLRAPRWPLAPWPGGQGGNSQASGGSATATGGQVIALTSAAGFLALFLATAVFWK